MIQHHHIKELRGLGEGLRHLDVLLRRLRIAGRVIVQEDEAEGFVADRPLHRFLDVDGRLIQPTDGDLFVTQKSVLHIDKGDEEMLLRLVAETLHKKGRDLLRRTEILQFSFVIYIGQTPPELDCCTDGDCLIGADAFDIREIPPVKILIAIDAHRLLELVDDILRQLHDGIPLPPRSQKDRNEIRHAGHLRGFLKTLSWLVFASHFTDEHHRILTLLKIRCFKCHLLVTSD